jgi:hypothetical protein
MNIDEIVPPGLISSLGQSAVFAAAAVVLWFYILRWLDKRAQEGPFKQVFDALAAEPVALAVYLGLRNIGVAYLVATVLATVRF